MGIDELSSLQDLTLSYSEVGAAGTALPDGYSHLGRNRVVGTGRRAFQAAGECVMSWEMHRRAGLDVVASGDRAAPGVDVLATMSFAGLTVRAPCRVVHAVEESDRIGFTYGTLTGHPEQGEESFNVVLEDDQVRFVVIAFSRPGRLLTRLGGPLNRVAQRMMLDRYQRAVESAIAA